MNRYLNETIRYLQEKYNFKEEEECDESVNSTSAYDPQETPFAFSKKVKHRKSNAYDEPVEETNNWFVAMESLYNNSRKRIAEINYKDYRTDETQTPRQKINSTIKEINRRLAEVEQMVHHSSKFKTEIGADSGVFYSDTIRKFQKISERLSRLQSKIREFNS